MVVATQKPASQWIIQAGISKNWFGSGNTSIYGEYGIADDWGAASAGRNFANSAISAATCPNPAGNSACSASLLNFTPVNGVIDTEMRVWGFGIVQKFDAAATDIYLGYRHFDADVVCNTANCGSRGDGSTNGKLPTQGIDVIVMGARVLF